MEALRIQEKIFSLMGLEPSAHIYSRDIPFGLRLDRSLRGREFLKASSKTSRLKVNADFELFARQSRTFDLVVHPHELDIVSKRLLLALELLPKEDWISESRIYKSSTSGLCCSLCNEEYFSFFHPIVSDTIQLNTAAEALIHQVSQEFAFAFDGELGFITSNFLLDANRAHLLSLSLQRRDKADLGPPVPQMLKKHICQLSSKFDLKLIRQYQNEETFAEGGQLFVHYDQGASPGVRADLDKYLAYLYFANEITSSEGDEIFNKIGDALENNASCNGVLMVRLMLTRFLEYLCKEINEEGISDKLRADLYREAIRDVLYLTKRGIHV